MPSRRHSPGPTRAETVAAVQDLLEQVRREGNAARFAVAVRLARRALRQLEPFPEETGLRARLLTNLAAFLAETGRVDEGLALLDEAVALDADQIPVALSSKGAILHRARFLGDALEALNSAVEYRPVPDDRTRSTALIRRGVVHTSMGRLALATDDYAVARSIAEDAHLPILAYIAGHNLGDVLHLQGDLPGALAAMDAASRIEADLPVGEPALDRARVLHRAGLLREAREFAERALSEFVAEKTPTEQVEALLVLSELCTAEGDDAAAAEYARRAVAVTGRHHMRVMALMSQLARVRLEPTASPHSRRSRIQRAGELAAALTAVDLPEEATAAHLVQAEAELDAGRTEDAASTMNRLAGVMRAPALSVRLQAHLIRGRIGLDRGERRVGLAELRRGLDDLADVQARFGSQDMQSGVSVHGRRLGRLGLRTAVEGGSPAEILQWLERARAVTTRLPAVHPPTDPELAELLGALRMATQQARESALTGRPDPALRRRVTELRHDVRARSWVTSGSGAARRPLTLTAVQRLLAADPTEPTVVAYLVGSGQVHALVITDRRAEFVSLGEWPQPDPRHQRRTADLNTLAADRVPATIRAVARRSLRAEFARLADQLIAPLIGDLRPGPLLISAAEEIAVLPFPLLPGLAGRPVSVTSSVTSALASAGRPGRAHLRGVLAVAGPQLKHSTVEAGEVARLHPGAGLLTDTDATGEAVLAQIPAGGLLHVAAHGHHEPESPLFSSVLLADGPLYAYDIAPNPTLPDQVVLSSCDVGQSTYLPGNEPLGLAAALLRSGVSSVIAAVSKVADEVASSVMVDYHRALLAGAGPAAALAEAVAGAGDEMAAFSCFGSGN